MHNTSKPTFAGLTSAQLVTVYNHHADKPVSRFESHKVAVARVTLLLAGTRPADAIDEAFRKTKPAAAAKKQTARAKGHKPGLDPAESGAKKAPGRARAAIVAACTRPEGASAAELYAATAWKHCSWNHHLGVAAKAAGMTPAVRKVDGATRYFLLGV